MTVWNGDGTYNVCVAGRVIGDDKSTDELALLLQAAEEVMG